MNHQLFKIVGSCGSYENIFLQCPSQNSLLCLKEGCRYSYESRRKVLGQRVVFCNKGRNFGNIINSSTSSKCGARNVVRLKEQLNKKKLLARAFPLFYMQRGCRKWKRLRVKDTQTMWNIFKLVVLHRFAESGFESGGLKTRYCFSLLWKQKNAI